MSPLSHPSYVAYARIDRGQFIQAQGGCCFYCGEPFSKKRRPTRDHFFPRCAGNGLFLNKVYAHAQCNCAKGSREPNREEIQRFKVLYLILGLPDFTAVMK